MARIAILVKSRSHGRVLAETLSGIHELMLCEGPDMCRDPDLVVVDGASHGIYAAELDRYRRQALPAVIPILLIVTSPRAGLATRKLWDKVEDVIRAPIHQDELLARVSNLVKLRLLSKEQSARPDGLALNKHWLGVEVASQTALLHNAFLETIQLLVKAAEFRDEETGRHIERTSHYCKHLAVALGTDREFQDQIFFAAPMHDVGKIGIPDAILLKPGVLQGEELSIMRTHAELGEHMLASGSSPYLQMGMTVAGAHHERWDGSGYPRGLKGEDIPLPARIMAVADIYDALRSKRPYKQALGHETTVDIIRKGDGRTLPGHFDPAVMNAFSREASTFKEIYATFS